MILIYFTDTQSECERPASQCTTTIAGILANISLHTDVHTFEMDRRPSLKQQITAWHRRNIRRFRRIFAGCVRWRSLNKLLCTAILYWSQIESSADKHCWTLKALQRKNSKLFGVLNIKLLFVFDLSHLLVKRFLSILWKYSFSHVGVVLIKS